MELLFLPLLIFGGLALGAGLLVLVFKLILIPIKLAFGLVGMILGVVFFAVLLPILIPVVIGVAGIGLAIAGDGAFLFTGMELATAVKYGLNIPILVPNNDAFGMIKVLQRDQYDEQFIGVDLNNPDFVQLAHAFGVYGQRVTTPAALGEALEKALTADKPTVIEIPWGWTWGAE